MPILSASKLSLTYGDSLIYSGISLDVAEKAKIGMVGPNGAGKTSLIRMVIGDLEPDSGKLYLPQNIKIGYVPQIAPPSTQETLRDEIKTAFSELTALEHQIEDCLTRLSNSSTEDKRFYETAYASLVEQYDTQGGYSYLNALDRMVTGIGLSQVTLDTPTHLASGGERTRAALAKALLSNPDLLILDEPTNYLDLNGLSWLERLLNHYASAFLVVSHDRHFLDKVVTSIWELDHEELNVYTGNYSKYRVQKGEQALWQKKSYGRQQEFIAREEAFIRRYKAGQRAGEAKGRAKRLDRLERLEVPDKNPEININGISINRTSQIILQTENLKVGFSTGFDPRKLMDVPDIKLQRGTRTAIIGDNGSGKTTFLQTILGTIPELNGTVTMDSKAELGYFCQQSDPGPEEASVYESLLAARNIPLDEVRPYLARFLFRGDDVFQTVRELSGGERSRLALARLLINQPNFLIMDEPTTHLDIATREAIEQVLLSYDGTILFVSHDRHLLSLLAQQIWIIDNSILKIFEGTFDELDIEHKIEHKEEIKKPPRTARIKYRDNPASPKRTPPRPKTAELEKEIDELESRQKEIELQLAEDSEHLNLELISNLGKEHVEIAESLERKWIEWAT